MTSGLALAMCSTATIPSCEATCASCIPPITSPIAYICDSFELRIYVILSSDKTHSFESTRSQQLFLYSPSRYCSYSLGDRPKCAACELHKLTFLRRLLHQYRFRFLS